MHPPQTVRSLDLKAAIRITGKIPGHEVELGYLCAPTAFCQRSLAQRMHSLNEGGLTCLSSRKGTAGRATREVSSRKMRVLEKGIAYRKVGSFLQIPNQTKK